jgi:hypothetical protein
MISGAIVRQTAGKIKDVLTSSDDEATDRRTGPEAAEGGQASVRISLAVGVAGLIVAPSLCHFSVS